MEPVQFVTGTALPLERSDIDTDQIIPSEWLKRIERTGFGAGLFSQWRDDRGFVLNRPEHAGASILVAGANFGIGSSREHAVWALVDYGFRAVISSRIADIFKSNSTRSGLVPVQVAPDAAMAIMVAVVAEPGLELTIDVEHRLVEIPAIGFLEPFELEETARQRLFLGLDDVSVTLAHETDIRAYEQRRATFMPSVGAASS